VKSVEKKISGNSRSRRAPDDPEQSKRFIDMAREVGADESAEGRRAFERALDKVIPHKEPKRSSNTRVSLP